MSIGDSQVEAIQVHNNSTFHGILNHANLLDKNIAFNQPIVSTSLGAAGRSLPDYIKYITLSKDLFDISRVYIVIFVNSTDFEESFREHHRDIIGKFFFEKNDGKFLFVSSPASKLGIFRRKMLRISALSRYLFINLEVHSLATKHPFCLLLGCEATRAKPSENSEGLALINTLKLKDAYLAAEYFVDHLIKLRPSTNERIRTILVLDGDRRHIYNPLSYSRKENLFNLKREYLIKLATLNGFSVIDMHKPFSTDYHKNKISFNFTNDSAHFSTQGHKIIGQQILKGIHIIENSNRQLRID